jgi:hypothetical protein
VGLRQTVNLEVGIQFHPEYRPHFEEFSSILPLTRLCAILSDL